MAQPRFLRRHYPHQVQGVRSTFVVDHLSQAAPPHLFLVQNKTGKKDVKGGSAAGSDNAKRCNLRLHESNIEQGPARSTS